MTSSAGDSSHLTISGLVTLSHGASLVFPSGPPTSIAAPKWEVSDDSEMAYCQREFFLHFCDIVPQIPVTVLLNNDCINFMSAEEAAPWLPIWMCASFYAIEHLRDESDNVIWWTQCALERCLRANRISVSLEAIDYFVKLACDPPELEPELHSALAQYRQFSKADNDAPAKGTS